MKLLFWCFIAAFTTGALLGWLLHTEDNREIKASILERNRSEAKYYQAMIKKEEKEMQLFSGYAPIKGENNNGKSNKN